MRRGSEGAWAAHKQKAEEVRHGEDGGEVNVCFVELRCVSALGGCSPAAGLNNHNGVTPLSAQVEHLCSLNFITGLLK